MAHLKFQRWQVLSSAGTEDADPGKVEQRAMIGTAQVPPVFSEVSILHPGQWHSHMGARVFKSSDIVSIAVDDDLAVGLAQIGDIALRRPVRDV